MILTNTLYFEIRSEQKRVERFPVVLTGRTTTTEAGWLAMD